MSQHEAIDDVLLPSPKLTPSVEQEEEEEENVPIETTTTVPPKEEEEEDEMVEEAVEDREEEVQGVGELAIASPPRGEDAGEEEEEAVTSFPWDNQKKWFSFGNGEVNRSVGPVWVKDEEVNNCMACSKPFDFFTRRHHCRYCGNIFCHACSSSYKLLPVEFGVREPQRTCRSCSAELEPIQDELAKSVSNQTRQLEFDPDAPSKYLNNPVSFSMTAEISKAAHAVENIFGYVPNSMITIDRSIPEALLKEAVGIAFLTIIKGGFLVSGKIGTGLVVARLPDPEFPSKMTWSAPTAIGTMGVGWGAQIGGELTDCLFILTRKDALESFSGTSSVAIGADLGVSVGPFGRTGEANMNFGDHSMAPCVAYSQSSGLFAGVSFEGAVISARAEVNRNFYGKDYSPREILSGTVPPPRAARVLYQVLDKVFDGDRPFITTSSPQTSSSPLPTTPYQQDDGGVGLAI